MAFKSFQEESRERYGRDFCGDKSQYATGEELKKGALLRIADALELMVKDKAELVTQVKALKNEADSLRINRDGFRAQAQTKEQELTFLHHQRASLRGCITRMKKQAKKA